MAKTKQYRIAFGESIKEVEERVNLLLNSGFTPYRGLVIAPSPEYVGESSPRLYMQVMIKLKTKKKKKEENVE